MRLGVWTQDLLLRKHKNVCIILWSAKMCFHPVCPGWSSVQTLKNLSVGFLKQFGCNSQSKPAAKPPNSKRISKTVMCWHKTWCMDLRRLPEDVQKLSFVHWGTFHEAKTIFLPPKYWCGSLDRRDNVR